ncbi:conserved Plasmodium protein, unknown function [Plasmodium knowlesi strain H]|uniref:Uncharacterized protein n=3 Tax=Plasmodium knowlesi TaxID=5850 RepID=A0A5K1V4E2_PLAKH|nr:conserved Plasmodium protein, unknown function [Plasmodium knowlesi strain H]OTN66542.1 Uncharacterized protein PKNOH_S08475300 [Plasmodium knowlesi]CAA9990078.1 conserved Plasmodium protein, unknown function [Plasmodium knowlesi strain H]SBO25743.1 conserved Plasmodium protein, unknown function [Plasmodium knowlesi strain H]SBO28550.1 conserved Plasmodium protein, unknown function [Plasmodium knowlesi strain H]VVS79552.1 conserved Plasmodium protein, unknown function [Plasmodium knowlesi s|eukprot:XP_002260545.1 hypothetical protein, conserved in Plasmodium species [Plasmodium knowlesi strain H]
MDLFGEHSENSCRKECGRTEHGRSRRNGAMRGRLIKPERSSEEGEAETNLFSVSSGDDKIGTEVDKRRTLDKRSGLFSESVNDKDNSEDFRTKRKRRKVRSKCLFSSTSVGGSNKSEKAYDVVKLEENIPQEGNSHCLFSSDEEEINQGDINPHVKNSNCLFRSTSEKSSHSETEVKGKNKGANVEGANVEGVNVEGANVEGANVEGSNVVGSNVEGSNVVGANVEGAKFRRRMYIREGSFDPNIVEKEKNRTRKKISSSRNTDLKGRSNIGNRRTYKNNRGRRGIKDTPYYNLHETKEEGMYRLINFEKLKKRASRKLNFMSIVNMANGGGDSSGLSSCSSSHWSIRSSVRPQAGNHRGEERTESTSKSEDDILNRTGVSYEASTESTEESKNDSAYVNEEKDNNRTIDVYSYYYLGKHVDNLVLNKNVEKMEGSVNCIESENLHDHLFGLGKDNSKRPDRADITSKGMHKAMSKKKIPQLDRVTSLKMKERRRKIGKGNNFMLQKNFKMYRNFKNINVELSRQNNLKGLNFKKMVVNFIRLVNKNMMEMKEQGEMDLSKEGNHSREDFKDTSDVEEWYATRGDARKEEERKTEVSLQRGESQYSQLEIATCTCIFCSDREKILTNEEMHVSTFKYMNERKEEDTLVKPFFMHSYVFTAFINYFIHYGRVSCVHRGGKTGGKAVSKPMEKNLQFYKFDKRVTRKYGIKRIILFVAKRVTLTSVGIHMEGSNMLQEEEEFVVVINFFKWRMMRRRYKEIVKVKRKKKEKENSRILKNFFFVVKAIDEYCVLCNIQVDRPNGGKSFRERERRYMNQPFCRREDNTPRNGCTFFGSSYFSLNEMKVCEIEDSLNRDLANSRLQFALVDSLRVSAGHTLYLFPAHILVLV